MTVNKLDLKPLFKTLRIPRACEAFEEQIQDPNHINIPYAELVSDMLNAEIAKRKESGLIRRLKAATIRHQDACMSNVDFKAKRGLNKAQIQMLGNCDWIRNHQNCIITGSTGAGKTWLASALANAACRASFTVRFVRVSRFLIDLSASHSVDRGFDKELRALRGTDLLVLDEWGMGQMTSIARADLLELIEDRCGVGSTLITSVLPVKEWSKYINDPSYADSILDRIVLNSHRIEINSAQSMRSITAYGAVKP